MSCPALSSSGTMKPGILINFWLNFLSSSGTVLVFVSYLRNIFQSNVDGFVADDSGVFELDGMLVDCDDFVPVDAGGADESAVVVFPPALGLRSAPVVASAATTKEVVAKSETIKSDFLLKAICAPYWFGIPKI